MYFICFNNLFYMLSGNRDLGLCSFIGVSSSSSCTRLVHDEHSINIFEWVNEWMKKAIFAIQSIFILDIDVAEKSHWLSEVAKWVWK